MWIDLEQPTDDLRIRVTSWIFTRCDDPYQGAIRAPGFPNLWFVQLPGTLIDDRAVFCSYWIEETAKTVRCDLFSTLGLPVDWDTPEPPF